MHAVITPWGQGGVQTTCTPQTRVTSEEGIGQIAQEAHRGVTEPRAMPAEGPATSGFDFRTKHNPLM